MCAIRDITCISVSASHWFKTADTLVLFLISTGRGLPNVRSRGDTWNHDIFSVTDHEVVAGVLITSAARIYCNCAVLERPRSRR